MCAGVGESFVDMGKAEMGLGPGKDAGEDTESSMLRSRCQKVAELRLKPRVWDSFQHLGSKLLCWEAITLPRWMHELGVLIYYLIMKNRASQSYNPQFEKPCYIQKVPKGAWSRSIDKVL